MSDLAGDTIGEGAWRMMPKRESVIYQTRVAPAIQAMPVVTFSRAQPQNFEAYSLPVYEPQLVSDAWRRPLTYKELAASQGIYLGSDLKWYMPKEVSVGIQPTPGDQIQDQADTFWTVLDVAQAGALTCWAMTCRNLVLVLGLNDTINIERPLIARDSAGIAQRDWQTIYNNIRCRVQLISQSEMEGRGIKGFQQMFKVTVDRQLVLTWEDRIKLRDGRYLDLKEYLNPERIDMLPEITALWRV